MVLCAAKNIEEARLIARGLLQNGLVACASILNPLESWFIWKEQIEEVSEVQLILKTTDEKYSQVEAWILENHSYEVPEILVVEAKFGYEKYLKWVEQSVENT
jgi:periplasmic divalent cation tolerance protein